MVPPNLTAVGDKLKDQALAEAVEGGGKKRRLPWLAVHMPRFEHTDDERAALLAAFISRDRVPDGAPESAAARTDAALTRAAGATSDEEESRLVAGQRLVGTGGFSCIACHDMGTYSPKNVAVPTHGSDLIGLGRRMRREFFLRWTRAPLRVRPGMEMPSYERPVAGVLHGDLALQLSALWDALNDRQFTPPINPSSVEQFLVVAPGGSARIVRDVFSKRGDDGAVARPLPSASTTAIRFSSISTSFVCATGPWGTSPGNAPRAKAGSGTWPDSPSAVPLAPLATWRLRPTDKPAPRPCCRNPNSAPSAA